MPENSLSDHLTNTHNRLLPLWTSLFGPEKAVIARDLIVASCAISIADAARELEVATLESLGPVSNEADPVSHEHELAEVILESIFKATIFKAINQVCMRAAGRASAG